MIEATAINDYAISNTPIEGCVIGLAPIKSALYATPRQGMSRPWPKARCGCPYPYDQAT